MYSLQVAKDSVFTNLVIDQAAVVDTSFSVSSLQYQTTYYWRVSATNEKGSSDWSEVWRFVTGKQTAIEQWKAVSPSKYNLYQNYPNPFNPSTTIRFSLPELTKVSLKVYDVLGREIFTLINKEMQKGEHRVVFEANDLPNGVYVYCLNAGQFVKLRKMIVAK